MRDITRINETERAIEDGVEDRRALIHATPAHTPDREAYTRAHGRAQRRSAGFSKSVFLLFFSPSSRRPTSLPPLLPSGRARQQFLLYTILRKLPHRRATPALPLAVSTPSRHGGGLSSFPFRLLVTFNGFSRRENQDANRDAWNFTTATVKEARMAMKHVRRDDRRTAKSRGELRENERPIRFRFPSHPFTPSRARRLTANTATPKNRKTKYVPKLGKQRANDCGVRGREERSMSAGNRRASVRFATFRRCSTRDRSLTPPR